MSIKVKSIEDLNKIYSDGEAADKAIWAEQRSNILLIAGEHYTGKGAKNWSRIRDASNIPADQKLRLTKNHTQKIEKVYVGNIVSSAPGVQVTPRNEKSNQDQKAAELNQSVWQYGKDTLGMDMKIISFVKDYVDCGEVVTKTFWNPYAGKFLGYKPKVDETTGQPIQNQENGEYEADMGQPVFEGQLQIKQFHPFNTGRHVNATDMETSPVIWLRHMMDTEELRKIVEPKDPEAAKKIESSDKDEFMVFDASIGGYTTVKNQTLVIEYYFRPCQEYPLGYFYIATKSTILFEGELPYGVWPINYGGFDPVQTSPRHRSILKQARPYQMEINRTASKIAEHQVTSDDKVLIQSGTKIASGGILPGVRAIQYSGQAPTILEGKAGAQYLDYMNGQISEMYQVLNVREDDDKDMAGADPFAMLFRSAKDKKRFSLYIQKFEIFLKNQVKTYLDLAKHYFTDEMLIPMVGKDEVVNISEFRNVKETQTYLKILPMSDDIHTMMGKTLAINHVLQYVGQNLDKDTIGKLIRNMPFGNFEKSFGDLSLDYDVAENFMLALDRGESPAIPHGSNKEYMIKKLDDRILKSDFRLLDQQIQLNYDAAKQEFMRMKQDELLAIQRAEQGFIPSDGPLIKTDLQVQEPNSTGGFKTTRAAFPARALEWLSKQLEVQGTSLEKLQNEVSQASIAQMANNMGPQGPQQPPPPEASAPNADLAWMQQSA